MRNNIIPDQVVMKGTVRALDPQMRQSLIERVHRTVNEIAAFFRSVMDEDSARARQCHRFLAGITGTREGGPAMGDDTGSGGERAAQPAAEEVGGSADPPDSAGGGEGTSTARAGALSGGPAVGRDTGGRSVTES